MSSQASGIHPNNLHGTDRVARQLLRLLQAVQVPSHQEHSAAPHAAVRMDPALDSVVIATVRQLGERARRGEIRPMKIAQPVAVSLAAAQAAQGRRSAGAAKSSRTETGSLGDDARRKVGDALFWVWDVLLLLLVNHRHIITLRAGTPANSHKRAKVV